MSKRVRNVRNRPIRTKSYASEMSVRIPPPLGGDSSDTDPDIKPNYLEDVIKAAVNLQPGTVNHINVQHDHDCHLLNGLGNCNCQPVVQMVVPS
jgi:hypothetical protein